MYWKTFIPHLLNVTNFLQLAGKLEAPQLRMEEKDGARGIDIV
jgi:hypothetical protein